MGTAVAVIAAAFLSAVLLAVINSVLANKTKREDWARQDLVADRLIASNLMIAQEAAKNTASNEIVANEAAKNTAISQATHELVNSAFTELMEAQFNAEERVLAAMVDAVAVIEADGSNAPVEKLQAVAAQRAKVMDLREKLATRAHRQTVADAHVVVEADAIEQAARIKDEQTK